MKPSVEKLYKVFQQEVKRQYDDGTVVGGLAKYAAWESDARADGLPQPLIQTVTERIRSYHKFNPQERQAILDRLWQGIGKALNESLPSLGSLKAEQARIKPPGKKAAGNNPTSKKQAAKKLQPAIPPINRTSEPDAPAYLIDLAPEPTSGARREIPEPGGLTPEERVALDAPLTVLPGVGPQMSKALARLGLTKLGDALYYFPRRYDDYSQLKPISRLWYGEEVTIIGVVQQVSLRVMPNRKMKLVEAMIGDGSGYIRATWFNQPWLVEKLRDKKIVLSGKVDQFQARLVMNSPDWEPFEEKTLHTNRIVPVYALTAEITQRWLRKTLHHVISHWAIRIPDPLPITLRNKAELMPLSAAIEQVHFPDTQERLIQARHRLAFEEIFYLQLGVLSQRQLIKRKTARAFGVADDWLRDRLRQLPFELTHAQRRVVEEIRGDLVSHVPMNRLIQGDVGSGKTVVAALAVQMVIQPGAQAALMAPTGILAEQHYRSFLKLMTTGNLMERGEIRLLVGATPDSEKQEIYQGLSEGQIKMVIGTHALIEPKVIFSDLQLVIIDEQHRFGVQQRGILREKGESTHLLVMTATPIPRSLALSVYGDLDLSIIDEMPPGRQEIATYIIPSEDRKRAYNLIRKQVEVGRQAFMIFPLVEESEKSEAKAAVEEHARLQKEVFPTLRLGLLHGRLGSDEKDRVMEQFRSGEYQVLVSTSVVEVGVDVPNATVMLVEGANRFGLAQLHQFRGRVGRGSHQSYCLLLPDKGEPHENERLNAMVETNDGFRLAEKDLEQRGPGEFLGTQQSGFSTLRMASLTDTKLIEKARRFAQELFEKDPDLAQPEHQPLAEAVAAFWNAGKSDLS